MNPSSSKWFFDCLKNDDMVLGSPDIEAHNKEESRQSTKPVGPCVFVIFGITGDLTSRLLFPALYNLAHSRLLPAGFAVVGFSLSNLNESQLRDKLAMDLRQAIGAEADSEIVQWLGSRVRFVPSDFQSPSGWAQLSSSRSGIAATLITFKSRWRSRSAWNGAGAITITQARCATWFPTISFSCWH